MRYARRFGMGGLMVAASLLAVSNARAGWVMGPNGPYWVPDPAPSVPYPYPNAMVGNTGPYYTSPPVNNPFTGQYNYDTASTSVYRSAYQPGRNTLMPGTSSQYVDRWVPDGGGGMVRQRGVAWVDRFGNPHQDMNYTHQTPYGQHVTRVVKGRP